MGFGGDPASWIRGPRVAHPSIATSISPTDEGNEGLKTITDASPPARADSAHLVVRRTHSLDARSPRARAPSVRMSANVAT